MGIFSNTSTNDMRTFLVFDIGSASVGGAIVRYGPKNRPEITKSIRSSSILMDEISGERLVAMIMRSLEEVAHQLLESIKESPQEIYVTLSAPWLASQTRMLHMHKSTPFVVTKEVIDDLIQAEIQRFHDGKIKEFAEFVEDHELLEHKTMRVRINGYISNNPIGKQGTNLEIASFMSIVESNFKNQIEQRLGRIFHSSVTSHSFLFASHSVNKQIFNNQAHSMILDIGGEITELGIVRGGILLQSATIPFGKNHVLRFMAKGLNVSLQEAASLLRMLDKDQLSPQRRYEVEPLVVQAHRQWLELFKQVLNDIAETSLIPHTIFLYADEDVLLHFKEIVLREDVHQYVSSQQEFTVVPMNIASLQGNVLDNEGRHDPFLITAALFAQALVLRDWYTEKEPVF